MKTKLWKEHLLDSRALRTHPDPILTPAPPLPNPFPLHLDDGSPSGLQDALDTIEKHLKEAGATDAVIETTLKGFPYALGEALVIKQNAATQPSKKQLLRTLTSLEHHSLALEELWRNAHPLLAEHLHSAHRGEEGPPHPSDFPFSFDLLRRMVQVSRSARQNATTSLPQKNPGQLHLYRIILFLAEAWIAANERGPKSVNWDSERHQSKFVAFAFEVIHGLNLTTDRRSVSSVTRQVAEELRTRPR